MDTVASAKIFSFYAKFLLDLIIPDSGSSSVSWISKELTSAVDITSKLITVYENAKNRGFLNDDLAYQYISLYLQIGELEKARKLADKLCNGHLSVTANLWVLRASIEMKWAAKESVPISKESLNSVFDVLRTVLSKLNVPEADSLWLMVCY